ncbi:DUF4340 domain-containing protein [Rhodopila sp.]|jgi:hypothetical protein|uniref:DUF4340 domain-containing protein n=1 Tax=Rhodopila sp. TaxID=2480087 RepID=UPI002BD5C456|nr:DUF4340 domain-containing protein [Rhodopila sp.]HVZ09212.1 DUF4340 domain-containing protein [Rhodopila sp.]
MTPRTVAVLVALGVVSLAGGWYFGPGSIPAEQTSVPRGALMFPGLAPRLQDATKIEIRHQDMTLTIEKRPAGAIPPGWGIASLHDYPVQDTKLRGMLTALTELRLAEPRTADPAHFARLGVEDPTQPKAAGDLLRVLDGTGKPIAEVIIGHRRVRDEPNVPEEVYVRRPGETQSWLAEGSLTADADPAQWLDRALLNIPADKVLSVTVGDGALRFERKDGVFALRQPAEHPLLNQYKVQDVGRALDGLTLMAVKPDADAPKLDDAGHAVFQTADGVAIQVSLFHAGKEVWGRFAASGTDKAEVDRLNARLAGWAFQLPNWKEKALVPTLADLKADEPAKPAASASAPDGDPAATPADTK